MIVLDDAALATLTDEEIALRGRELFGMLVDTCRDIERRGMKVICDGRETKIATEIKFRKIVTKEF